MFEITSRITRPSLDIEFFSVRNNKEIPAEVLIYFFENYVKTGKKISENITLSDDKLEIIQTEIWDSKKSYQESLCDPYIDDNITEHAKKHISTFGIKYEIISAKEI